MPAHLEYRQDPSAVRSILKSLPNWFGDPDAIDSYEHDAGSEAFQSLLAVDSGRTVGVALVLRHFREAAELHLIAVAPDVRGRGVGRALVERVAADLTSDGCRLLSVHTVRPSFDSEPYADTRQFYKTMGSTHWKSITAWTGPALL
ncbi:MAG: GNAT family N-acetyltransferase [Actinomycetota bacterium]|nr:GNAT family N-acetyltransferase [Actinomycetota bacterium]